MAMRDRIDALQTRHAQLDQQLLDEVHRPWPNEEEVSRLKREKLKVKDELAKLHSTELHSVH